MTIQALYESNKDILSTLVRIFIKDKWWANLYLIKQVVYFPDVHIILSIFYTSHVIWYDNRIILECAVSIAHVLLQKISCKALTWNVRKRSTNRAIGKLLGKYAQSWTINRI